MIGSICARHGVPIGAVALQFVLANPHIATVLIGPGTVAELDANLAAAEFPVPELLWDELERAGIIPGGAPRPQGPALSVLA